MEIGNGAFRLLGIFLKQFSLRGAMWCQFARRVGSKAVWHRQLLWEAGLSLFWKNTATQLLQSFFMEKLADP